MSDSHAETPAVLIDLCHGGGMPSRASPGSLPIVLLIDLAAAL